MPGFHIKKGTKVECPIHASHHDPEFFPDPERFDPERFYGGNLNKIDPFTYLPFGTGPRMCIAQRFALVEIKIIAAQMLSNFKLLSTHETKRMKFKGGSLLVLNNDGIKVQLESRT